MIVPSAPSGFGRAVRSPRPLLLVMWELPQNLLGAGLFAVSLLRGDIVSLARDRRRLFIHSRTSSVSLGWFVYFQTEDNRWFAMNDDTRAHEYGHSIQSRWLGPLYLPLVAIPIS